MNISSCKFESCPGHTAKETPIDAESVGVFHLSACTRVAQKEKEFKENIKNSISANYIKTVGCSHLSNHYSP